jgi:hypothetical protein
VTLGILLGVLGGTIGLLLCRQSPPEI